MLSSSDIPRWTVNSLLYSLVSVVLVLLFASMAGYAFAKKRFPGREIMFWAFLATLMVPFQATLIPSYILVSRLDWVDSYWGLIVPTLANSQAVFLMRQFIVQLPDELFEAAEIDGASEWRIFTMIVLPLIRPVLATLGIFVFLWHWNDFLWPLVDRPVRPDADAHGRPGHAADPGGPDQPDAWPARPSPSYRACWCSACCSAI